MGTRGIITKARISSSLVAALLESTFDTQVTRMAGRGGVWLKTLLFLIILVHPSLRHMMMAQDCLLPKSDYLCRAVKGGGSYPIN